LGHYKIGLGKTGQDLIGPVKKQTWNGDAV